MVVASLEILGGHAVQAETLAGRLRDSGYEVTLLPINPPFPRPLAPVRRWPFARTLVNEALYLPSLRALRAADVVHVFAASYWAFLLASAPALLAARRFGKRVVLNYHSGEADDHLRRWGVLVHPFLRMAHSIVVPSSYLRDVFAAHGYRARVVPNVVDLDCFRYRDRTPLRPRILSTRNLEAHYRVEDAIRAFAMVRRDRPEATLTIAGSGSQESRLRRLATALGAGGVQFVGRVEPGAMPALYDDGDIFVNASVVDNQPISLLEAFAAGLPVVSTATGDIGAMVHDGETGVLAPPRDPAALARSLRALLERPDRALAIARRARQAVEAHAWPRVGEAWAAVYAGAGA